MIIRYNSLSLKRSISGTVREAGRTVKIFVISSLVSKTNENCEIKRDKIFAQKIRICGSIEISVVVSIPNTLISVSDICEIREINKDNILLDIIEKVNIKPYMKEIKELMDKFEVERKINYKEFRLFWYI